jgi:hypothetical protein
MASILPPIVDIPSNTATVTVGNGYSDALNGAVVVAFLGVFRNAINMAQ